MIGMLRHERSFVPGRDRGSLENNVQYVEEISHDRETARSILQIKDTSRSRGENLRSLFPHV